MTQNSIGSYTVQPNETVTIEVVATKVNEFAKAALDNADLSPVNTNPLRYRFDVSKPSGEEHFVVVRVQFDATSADDSKYELFAQGSAGNDKFKDFTIRKADPDLSRTLVFGVA